MEDVPFTILFGGTVNTGMRRMANRVVAHTDILFSLDTPCENLITRDRNLSYYSLKLTITFLIFVTFIVVHLRLWT
ncbi:hypothetical protein ANN_12504 [Periplaneta americana]|uniref:Uncharacterized protein n=1 Tax=Periplaneta americana TaxID=6978 RepID=A0ABQ8TIX1_PERAM|nr:hypothetical protein ANN_12504 [Periplaneta americana]